MVKPDQLKDPARTGDPGFGALGDFLWEVSCRDPEAEQMLSNAWPGPLRRHHHRTKHTEGWQLEQPEPGKLIWRTPASRTYTTQPTRYPT